MTSRHEKSAPEAKPDLQADESHVDERDIFEARSGRVSADEGGQPIARATDLTGVNILKHENLFMLSNAHGDIRPDGRGLGLYDSDTRVLSRYDLLLNGVHPVVLRGGPAASFEGTIQQTNPDMFGNGSRQQDGSEIVLRRQSLGIVRDRVIAGGFRERIEITNYTERSEQAVVTIELDADFADIFELRGAVRAKRGERLANELRDGPVTFAYRGLDAVVRTTHVAVSPHMDVVTDGAAPDGTVLLRLDRAIAGGGAITLTIEIWYEEEPAAGEPRSAVRDNGDASRPRIDVDQALAMHRAWRQSSAAIDTSDILAERALERASADLRLLINAGPEPGDRYIAAGVPWFSCLFGRDSIITSLQLLAVRPQVAQNTLRILARLQATTVDDYHDAQPGKILHELRTGELARTGEIPHTPYYGTVDATPLWLVLLDQYQRWTGDDELVDQLWPNAIAALGWIDNYGDSDNDGFVEYERHSARGLSNQGWKDSADSIRFRDGRLAAGAIALVEVQGYVFAARRGLARLARLRGDTVFAKDQETAAEKLRESFEDAFWMPEADTYALALDGQKNQVDAIASNAGHALWTGIATAERAESVARVLTTGAMWSGWGIRTLSSEMVGYNPIGYHLGTVWPHDNAICAAGFARYGLSHESRKVAGALLEATVHFREARLPELFCGFDRGHSPLPVPYPVACSPQAWAAAALFQIVAATLGMQPDAHRHRLELLRPSLPESLPELRLRNVRVGDALVDIAFTGQDGTTSVEVKRRTGDVDVTVRL
jgi:glycogen debranching enzyme